jgi:hypothetical protein
MATPNYNAIAKNIAKSVDSKIAAYAEADAQFPAGSNDNTELKKAIDNLSLSAYKKSGGSSASTSPSSPFGQLYKASQGESNLARLTDSDLTPDLLTLKTKEGMFGEIVKQVQRESDLQTLINEKVGLTGELSENFRNSIFETMPIATSLGYGFKNVADMITRMGEQSGRFNLISQETLQNSYAVSRAFVGDIALLPDYFTEFEKIGKGAYDTLKAISDAGTKSLSLGLNSKKTTESLKQNIERLNEYGFKNGVEGLNRMVQRSVEFRMNLGEVFKIADNVMDPDKAIALTANLQVLGGAIGDFNDPLKLMYMATNNVEGLQKSLIDAAKGLATYNTEQGRFEITGVNLRRAREMAQQLGVDYKELAKGAIAGQERMLANSELMGKGLNISKEDKEFITNMSQMKGGQMVITIPEDVAKTIGSKTEISLRELTSTQIEQLKGMRSALEEKTPEQIAKGQFTSIHNIEMMMQGIYRTIVQDVTKLSVGKEGIDIKGIADRLTPGVKSAFVSAEQKNEGFVNYVKDLYGTIKAGMNNLTGGFATQFESVASKEMEKFIVGAAKASPEKLQAQYQSMMDQFGQFYQQSLKGKSINGASIQNKLTIVDQSKGSKSFYQNQTKAAYIDDGIE